MKKRQPVVAPAECGVTGDVGIHDYLRSINRRIRFGLARDDDVRSDRVVVAERGLKFRIPIGSALEGRKVRVLLVGRDLVPVVPADLANMPISGSKVLQAQERRLEERSTEFLKLVTRTLPRHAFAGCGCLEFDLALDARRDLDAALAGPVRISRYAPCVGREDMSKKVRMELKASGREERSRHAVHSNSRFSSRAVFAAAFLRRSACRTEWMDRATAAAMGGGNAFPTWR